jgi:1-acyl-sn-glycerol-3-phosphate acyltransferase
LNALPPTVLGETALGRWRRRVLTLSALHLAVVLLPVLGVATLPVLLPGVPGAGRRRRFARFLALYLVYELAGVWAALGLFLTGRARDRAAHAALQRWWAGGLMRALTHTFDLELTLDPASDALDPATRCLALFRHVSTADTLLPAFVLQVPLGLRLRYVMKRELLAVPCLDVVGHRLPNLFVRRGGQDTATETAAVAALSRGLGPGEGVLIFPEGTRATPAKRAEAQARLVATDSPRAAARGLRHLLPIRPGGTLAVLAADPELDLVCVGHVGFEPVHHFSDLFRGVLTGAEVRVRLWRFPASERPAAAEAQLAWLDARWAEVDAWVEAQPARRPRAET